jgi:hypothetical protein
MVRGKGWIQLCTLPTPEDAEVNFRECGFLLGTGNFDAIQL